MKKINKSKLYELIGKATVRATVWAMSVDKKTLPTI